MQTYHTHAIALASAILLSACGGSSSSGDDTQTPAPSPTPGSETNEAPVASSVTITDINGKTFYTRDTLEVSYQYSDAENDAEGETLIRWLVNDTEAGTGNRYTPTPEDAGKNIIAEVTAVAASGTATGTPVTTPVMVPEKRDFILFEAINNDGQRVTYTTDGSGTGTEELGNFNTHEDTSELIESIQFNDKQILVIETGRFARRMAVTDGTPDGTTLFTGDGFDSLRPQGFTEFDGKIFFSGYSVEDGQELWTTDGTPERTQIFKNIAPGYLTGNQAHDSRPSYLTVLNNRMYFRAYAAYTGSELWSSDGSISGTQLLHDINIGYYGSSPEGLNAYKDKLFYTVPSGFNIEQPGVYIYDQTDGSKTLLNLDKLDKTEKFIKFGDLAFFTSGRNDYAWLSNGTRTGTRSISGPSRTAPITMAFTYNNALYVTTAGKLFTLNADQDAFTAVLPTLNNIQQVAEFNGALYLTASDSGHPDAGIELFRFNGAEITLVKDISDGMYHSNPGDFHILNDKMIFTAQNAEHGRELWITDGTTEGTHVLKDIKTGNEGSSPSFCHLSLCR